MTILKKLGVWLLKVIFGDHWETTLAGIAGGLIVAIGQYLSAGGPITWSGLWAVIALYVVGRFVPSIGGVKRMLNGSKPTV